jgi:hypothetical protein
VRALALVLAAVAASGAEDALPVPAPAFERTISVPAPGLTAVTLDRHVYEGARPDLGDLRVLDDRATAVACVLDRGLGEKRPETRPVMRNRGFAPDGSATVVLDFGRRLGKDRLVLGLTGDNFRRRVTVEGSDDGESWTTLTDDAWVFAIPGPEAARYEGVRLPENDFPLLRVSVRPGARERGRIWILGAWVPAGRGPGRREETLSPGWSRAPQAREGETWLTLDLGARHQPFEGVVLEVADERFFREVRTEVREDVTVRRPDGPAPAERWHPLGQGVVYRIEDGGSLRERLSIDARGRARALRVRILNGDDRPLVVTGVRVRVPVERLIFEAEPGTEYHLTYGAPHLEPPVYDLARTLGEDPAASAAELGPPVRRAVEADVLPWSERHPLLLWVGLLLVVAALGLVTWRALRSV